MRFPTDERRSEEIRNGSPMSEAERKAHNEWLAINHEKHSRAGKLGGRRKNIDAVADDTQEEITCCKKHRIAFTKDKCDICDLQARSVAGGKR